MVIAIDYGRRIACHDWEDLYHAETIIEKAIYIVTFRLTWLVSGMRYFLVDTMQHDPVTPVGFVPVRNMLDTAVDINDDADEEIGPAMRSRVEEPWLTIRLMAVLWLSGERVTGLFTRRRVSKGT